MVMPVRVQTSYLRVRLVVRIGHKKKKRIFYPIKGHRRRRRIITMWVLSSIVHVLLTQPSLFPVSRDTCWTFSVVSIIFSSKRWPLIVVQYVLLFKIRVHRESRSVRTLCTNVILKCIGSCKTNIFYETTTVHT